MRIISRVLFLGGLLLAALPACIGDQDDPSSTTQAATADQCLLDDISWPDPDSTTEICAAPWTFDEYDTAIIRHEDCGNESCELNKVCWIDQGTVRPSRRIHGVSHAGCGFVLGVGLICRPDWDEANRRCTSYKNAKVRAYNEPANQRVTRASVQVSLASPSNAREHTFDCQVSLDYQKRLRSAQCGCERYRYKTCEVADPNTTRRVVTSSGLSLAQVRAQHAASRVHQQISSTQIEPACASAQDMPSSDPTGKLERLLAGLDDSSVASPGSEVFSELLRRAKQTYEMLGDGISDSALQSRILALYDRYPDVVPACGVDAELDQLACGDARNGAVSFCTRLTSQHVSGDLTVRDYGVCLEALASLARDVESETCADDVEDIAIAGAIHSRLHDKLLARFARDAVPNTSPADGTPTYDEPAIAAALHNLDRWFAERRRMIDGAAAMDELTVALNKFWQAAHGLGLIDGGWVAGAVYQELADDLQAAKEAAEQGDDALASELIEDALATSEARTLALDKAILVAVFSEVSGPDGTQVPALQGAPLARLAGEALASLLGQLESFSEYHDAGCALLNCASMTTPTTLSLYWQILSRLDRDGADGSPSLQNALAASTDPLLGWRSVFEVVATRQPRLLAALADAEHFPALHFELLDQIARARDRNQSYRATGMFSPAIGNVLETGVHSSHRATILGHIAQQAGWLSDARSQLEADLVALVDRTVQSNNSATATAELEARRAELLDRMQQLETKRRGYNAMMGPAGTATGSDEPSLLEAMLEDWARSESASDDGQLIRVADTVRVEALTGDDAKFVRWDTQDLDELAVHRMTTAANQLVSISPDAGAQWSPNCALRKVRLIEPDVALNGGSHGTPVTISGTSTPVGPEGYTIAATSSGWSASSDHKSYSGRITAGVRAESCAGTPFGELTGSSAKVCGYVDASASFEVGWSDSLGDEQRTSAQFSSGIFLPSTPFKAPAGSLLVIEVPEGRAPERRNVRDVHLVRGPHTTLAIKEPADLYFVVNDTRRCESYDTQNRLSLSVGVYSTVGAAAEQLIERMAYTMDTIRAKRDLYAARGEILGTELHAIEADAKLHQVRDGATIAVDEYPPALRDLFYRYLRVELSKLEAAVRLANIERELVHVRAGYRNASLALHNAKLNGYLVRLVPQWTIRGLRLRQMRESSTNLAYNLRHYLLPLLQLWYPPVASGLGSVQELTELANVDIDASPLDIANAMVAATETISMRVANAALPYPANNDTGRPVVSLRFPKPERMVSTCANTPSARCGVNGASAGFRYATVSQSQRLWGAVDAPRASGNHVLEFSVAPDDLYAHQGSNYLSCNLALPVVRRIGVVLSGFPSSRIPAEQRAADADIPEGAVQTFVTELGADAFELAPPVWRALNQVPFIYIYRNYEDARRRLLDVSQDIRGVTPFGQFRFELPAAIVDDWKLRDAASIDLVFELEGIQTGADVGASACD